MAKKSIPTKPSNAPKVKPYVESKRIANPPKGFKKDNSNQPDPKKVREYFSKKK